MKGETGLNLLVMLESRLDNVVYKLGFAPTRPAARQLVSHGHFLVNNKKVNIASYRLKPGDAITVRSKSKKLDIILNSIKMVKGDLNISWLSVDKAKRETKSSKFIFPKKCPSCGSKTIKEFNNITKKEDAVRRCSSEGYDCEKIAIEKLKPVSYTHLTLPTT